VKEIEQALGELEAKKGNMTVNAYEAAKSGLEAERNNLRA
jgi:hypothetical protein